MADIPSQTHGVDKNATSSDSAEKKIASGADCQLNSDMSRNATKRKQTTLDQYLSKKSVREVEVVGTAAVGENKAIEPVTEISVCHKSDWSETVEAKQAEGENIVAETLHETLQYGSSQEADAVVATLEYSSDSMTASEHNSIDDRSMDESSPERLELGASASEMRAAVETSSGGLPPLRPSADHTVLFVPDTVDEQCICIPKPFPEKVDFEHDRWDADHVRLPYSPQNKLLINHTVVHRWQKITFSLENAATWNSSYDVEKAILSYNKYRWNFGELHRYFRTLTEEEHDLFFSQTLPKMAELALSLPSICTQPIPLLRKQKEARISMSQQQAACLLANAFFCTFPSRSRHASDESNEPHLPSINFNNLYSHASSLRYRCRHAKLDCLFHYFRRVTTNMPQGTLTFKRQVLGCSPNWAESAAKLQKLRVVSNGTIEDDGTGMLQVDFANKYLGGGVLGDGCVQEEIRFVICPELIVSRLVTEELDQNESLLVTGCERFSNYKGYGSTTRWLSDHRDRNGHDRWGQRTTQVVAIDAKVCRSLSAQLLERSLLRELNKAYCGFQCGDDQPCAVATGNWGCGAFGGDPRVKALVQLMAAAESNRPVCYFTFGDCDLCRDIFRVWESASLANSSIGELWRYILEAAEHLHSKKNSSSWDIYQYIIGRCNSGQ